MDCKLSYTKLEEGICSYILEMPINTLEVGYSLKANEAFNYKEKGISRIILPTGIIGVSVKERDSESSQKETYISFNFVGEMPLTESEFDELNKMVEEQQKKQQENKNEEETEKKVTDVEFEDIKK